MLPMPTEHFLILESPSLYHGRVLCMVSAPSPLNFYLFRWRIRWLSRCRHNHVHQQSGATVFRFATFCCFPCIFFAFVLFVRFVSLEFKFEEIKVQSWMVFDVRGCVFFSLHSIILSFSFASFPSRFLSVIFSVFGSPLTSYRVFFLLFHFLSLRKYVCIFRKKQQASHWTTDSLSVYLHKHLI